MTDQLNFDIYAAMQSGEPKISFIKTCVGKVLIKVFNPFTELIEEKIISGNPFVDAEREKVIIDLWSDKEELFFRKVNARLLADGSLIEYSRKTEKKKIFEGKNFNAISDEEIVKALNEPFYTFKSILNKMTSDTAVNRVLFLARDLEKSEKLIAQIEQRLAEIQKG